MVQCSSTGCPRPVVEGKKTCQYHLDYQKRYRQEGRAKPYERHVWDGVSCLIPTCNNPSAPGRRLCQDHLDYQAKYRRNNLEKYRAANLRSNGRLKAEAIAAYGGKCVVCGETDPIVLQVDHINGRNKGEAKRSGVNELRRLKVLGFPKGDIQLLCANCHTRKTYSQLGYRVSDFMPDGV